MSTPRRRPAAAALLAGALVLAPAAAHADDELSLSLDGTTWTPDITAPLFDPAMRWVPGDVETATFFVRNNAPEGARLDVTLRADAQESLLAEGWVVIKVSTDDVEGATTTGTGPSPVLVDAPVPGAQAVPVEVEVTFDEDAPDDTRLRATSLAFDVTLTQTQEIGGGEGTDPDGPDDPDGQDPDGSGSGEAGGNGAGRAADRSGALPDTGSSTPAWLLPAGMLAVALGAGLSTRTRPSSSHPRQDLP